MGRKLALSLSLSLLASLARAQLLVDVQLPLRDSLPPGVAAEWFSGPLDQQLALIKVEARSSASTDYLGLAQAAASNIRSAQVVFKLAAGSTPRSSITVRYRVRNYRFASASLTTSEPTGWIMPFPPAPPIYIPISDLTDGKAAAKTSQSGLAQADVEGVPAAIWPGLFKSEGSETYGSWGSYQTKTVNLALQSDGSRIGTWIVENEGRVDTWTSWNSLPGTPDCLALAVSKYGVETEWSIQSINE
ncbi:MAG: hypothetical protein MUC92_07925 [Fimbriimonadaceae bacterium]|jgi:hypothetical protein|nr:hypothetical protein [Fimbriimonadaceae bacterium]